MKNVNFVSAVNCFLVIWFKNGTISHFSSECEFRVKSQLVFIVTSILHNMRQHDNKRKTWVQHDTTRHNTSATRDNMSTTWV